MIVQEHFPPAPTTAGLESGPLFGVQFSQLPCSDLNTRFGTDLLRGPKRSPLGLAADPGGFPLYKNGVVVGGIGVMGDGDYAFDNNVLDVNNDAEEAIALAGTQGFAAPEAITADKIAVDGTLLRFSDMTAAGLAPLQGNLGLLSSAGLLISVRGYTSGPIIAGAAYGSAASGYRQASAAEFAFPDAFVLSDGAGANRYPARAGTDGAAVAQPLTAAEAQAVLEEAYRVMSRARAQIRRPLDSRAQVTISLVDTYGAVLGLVRSPDAPVFGTDVSLQKARTVAFFSNPVAAHQLLDDVDAGVAEFVQRTRDFFADPSALKVYQDFERAGAGIDAFTTSTSCPVRTIGSSARRLAMPRAIWPA